MRRGYSAYRSLQRTANSSLIVPSSSSPSDFPSIRRCSSSATTLAVRFFSFSMVGIKWDLSISGLARLTIGWENTGSRQGYYVEDQVLNLKYKHRLENDNFSYPQASSSRKLRQFPSCWPQFSWYFPGAGSDDRRWRLYTAYPPILQRSPLLSPTSGAGSYTAWAGWPQSHEAFQCSEPLIQPGPQSLSIIYLAQECHTAHGHCSEGPGLQIKGRIKVRNKYITIQKFGVIRF